MQQGIDAADRDVATYRLATLFGQSKLVARSEKVVLQGKDGEIHGHMMDKVNGKDRSGTHSGYSRKKAASGKNDLFEEEDIKGRVTGGFIKNLYNLMLLDYICGQTDRHTANYIVKTDESGNLISVVGIDNNLAFPGDDATEFECAYLHELGKVLSESAEKNYFKELNFLKEKDGQPLDIKGIFIDHKGLSSVQTQICNNIIFSIGRCRMYH